MQASSHPEMFDSSSNAETRAHPHAAKRMPNPASPRPLETVDTRVKLAISLMASVMTIAIGSLEGQMVLFLCSAAYVLAMRKPKIVAIAYAVLALMLLIATGCVALVQVFASMPEAGIMMLLVPFLRLIVMINVILPLAFTSPIQSLLTTLKSLKLPYYLYIPLAVTIRFIPTFLFDIRQIGEALRIRGYKLGPKQLIRRPFFTMRLVTLPLLFRSLKTLEDLGVAAEMKGLGSGSTLRPYRALIWTRRDTLLLLTAFMVCVAAALCHYYWGTAQAGGMH